MIQYRVLYVAEWKLALANVIYLNGNRGKKKAAIWTHTRKAHRKIGITMHSDLLPGRAVSQAAAAAATAPPNAHKYHLHSYIIHILCVTVGWAASDRREKTKKKDAQTPMRYTILLGGTICDLTNLHFYACACVQMIDIPILVWPKVYSSELKCSLFFSPRKGAQLKKKHTHTHSQSKFKLCTTFAWKNTPPSYRSMFKSLIALAVRFMLLLFFFSFIKSQITARNETKLKLQIWWSRTKRWNSFCFVWVFFSSKSAEEKFNRMNRKR